MKLEIEKYYNNDGTAQFWAIADHNKIKILDTQKEAEKFLRNYKKPPSERVRWEYKPEEK